MFNWRLSLMVSTLQLQNNSGIIERLQNIGVSRYHAAFLISWLQKGTTTETDLSPCVVCSDCIVVHAYWKLISGWLIPQYNTSDKYNSSSFIPLITEVNVRYVVDLMSTIAPRRFFCFAIYVNDCRKIYLRLYVLINYSYRYAGLEILLK